MIDSHHVTGVGGRGERQRGTKTAGERSWLRRACLSKSKGTRGGWTRGRGGRGGRRDCNGVASDSGSPRLPPAALPPRPRRRVPPRRSPADPANLFVGRNCVAITKRQGGNDLNKLKFLEYVSSAGCCVYRPVQKGTSISGFFFHCAQVFIFCMNSGKYERSVYRIFRWDQNNCSAAYQSPRFAFRNRRAIYSYYSRAL